MQIVKFCKTVELDKSFKDLSEKRWFVHYISGIVFLNMEK